MRKNELLAEAVRLRNAGDFPGQIDFAARLYEWLMTEGPEVLATTAPQPASRRWVRNNLSIDTPPAELIEGPMSSRALALYLEAAAASKRGMKAIGDGWGFSTAGQTTGWFVPMRDHFDRVLEVYDAGGSTYCRFLGGTRVATLESALVPAKKALINRPGFRELTFAGTAAMGGQGSGLGIGPLSSQIRSIVLLRADRNGKALEIQLEREGPPLDLHRKEGVELRRVDSLFEAAVTSLGGLGIVTELTIEVRSEYFLKETRELMEWREVADALPDLFEKQKLPEGDPDALHSIEIWILPYPIGSGEVQCVLGKRAWHKGPPQGQRPPSMTHGTPAAFAVLCEFMREVPVLIPFMLHRALATTVEEDVVMRWDEALDFGSTNCARVKPAACAIDAIDTVPCVDRLIALLQARARDRGDWVTSPIGLRFAAAATAWMSLAHGRETCLIEMPELACTRDATETLEWFLREAVPEGRPHWGQFNPLDALELYARYPKEAVGRFRQALHELDPKAVFANELIRDLRDTDPDTGPSRKAAMTATPVLGDTDDQGIIQSYSRLFSDSRLDRTILPDRDDEIIATLKTARMDGGHFAIRGGGYALDSQSVACSMHSAYLMLTHASPERFTKVIVDPIAKRMTAGALARWHDIVHETTRYGLLPQVIVTGPNVTVGGSLSSNSIGQASRRFGHEADGVVSITVALPGLRNSDPQIMTLNRPDSSDQSKEAKLFRAIIGGYGLLGIILEATYDLIELPGRDPDAPPDPPRSAPCDGTWNRSAPPKYVTKTTITPFHQDQLRSMLSLLKGKKGGDGSYEDDGFYKACVLLWSGEEWAARLTTTSIELRGEHDPVPLVLYNGNSVERQWVERLMSNMGTGAAANAVAAHLTQSEKEQPYVDPLCGYLFTMLANDCFKTRLAEYHPHVERLFAPSVQMTYLVPLPEENVEKFLLDVFDALRFKGLLGVPDLKAMKKGLTADKQLWAFISNREREAQALDLQYRLRDSNVREPRVTDADSEEDMIGGWLQRILPLGMVIPALFEMVWVRGDDHTLSSAYRMDGIAVSLAFQGPGVRGDFGFGWLRDQIYRVLHEVSDLTVHKYGGRVHLTKNVFPRDQPEDHPRGPEDPPPQREDTREFIRKMLGQRLNDFRALRAQYDEAEVLHTEFAEEILGI